MSSAESIARRFLSAWNPGRQHVLEDLADPDIVARYSHFPEPIRGVDAYRAMIEETLGYFPDLETTALEVVAGDGRAAVRWKYTGTHESGEMYGLEATGREVEVHGASFYRIVDGRVVEETGVGDTFSLMIQLGAAPAPVEG